MEYDRVKFSLSSLFSRSFSRRFLHLVLHLVFPRAWWVRRLIRRAYFSRGFRPFFLDVGMGFGQYSEYLLRRYPKCRGIGMEVDMDHLYGGLSYFRRRYKGRFTVVLGDVQCLPFKEGIFGLELVVDVMEHIPDDKAAFRELARVLHPFGSLILHTPRLKPDQIYDEGKSPSPKVGRWSVEEHVRDGYEDEKLKSEIEQLDLRIRGFYRSYGFGGKIAWVLLQRVPMTLLARSWWLLPVVGLYMVMVIIPGLGFILVDLLKNDHPQGGGLLLWAQKPPQASDVREEYSASEVSLRSSH